MYLISSRFFKKKKTQNIYKDMRTRERGWGEALRLRGRTDKDVSKVLVTNKLRKTSDTIENNKGKTFKIFLEKRKVCMNNI